MSAVVGSGAEHGAPARGRGIRIPLNVPLERVEHKQATWRTLALLRAEASAIDELAACAPVAAPRHVAFGQPGEGFGLPWSVQTWVAGDLGHLIRALRAADVRGRPFRGRGA